MNDPSKPPHFHPDSGGSTTNNPPEPPSHGGAGGSSSKRKITTSHNNEQEGLSTPTKRHQTESSSTGKDTTTATTTTAAAATTTFGLPRHWDLQNIATPEPWRREEIHLLKDILDFYLNNGRYPYSAIDDLQDFFKNWVQERGFYRDDIDLNRRMESLNLRFLTNLDKKSNGEDIEATMDSIEREIFQLSNRVWGTENDNNDDDDDNLEQYDDNDLKDEPETIDDNGDVVDLKDSCKDSIKETGISGNGSKDS